MITVDMAHRQGETRAGQSATATALRLHILIRTVRVQACSPTTPCRPGPGCCLSLHPLSVSSGTTPPPQGMQPPIHPRRAKTGVFLLMASKRTRSKRLGCILAERAITCPRVQSYCSERVWCRKTPWLSIIAKFRSSPVSITTADLLCSVFDKSATWECVNYNRRPTALQPVSQVLEPASA